MAAGTKGLAGVAAAWTQGLLVDPACSPSELNDCNRGSGLWAPELGSTGCGTLQAGNVAAEPERLWRFFSLIGSGAKSDSRSTRPRGI